MEENQLEGNEKDENNIEKSLEEKKIDEKETSEQKSPEIDEHEKKQLEKEQQKKVNKVIPNYSLFVIPSWGELLGYPTLGVYVNQKVSKIISDVVIFLSGAEYSFTSEKGTCYYLFGLGYYFLKFELESGKKHLQRDKYIIDNRPLTGLIISDFVYDYMATSRNITLEDDRDVIITEKVIKVPINLSHKTENQITFIKGVLMRNLFIPNKDIILEMLDKIRSPDTFQIKSSGHFLLSTHWDSYNKILISDKMRGSLGSSNYLNPTAGLNEITFGADQHLNDVLSPENLNIIEKIIDKLKNVYSNLNFDPMYLYSILENSSSILKPESEPITKKEITVAKLMPKESLFITAESQMSSFVEWPEKFKRNLKEEIEIKPPTEKPQLIPGVKLYESKPTKYVPTATIIDQLSEKEKDFQLRVLKSEDAVNKPLPAAPQGDPEEILLYVKYIVEENYDMKSFAMACGLARDNLRKIMLQSDYMWELSKYERMYQNKPHNLSLSPRDKQEIIQKLDGWITKLEKERLERERLEKERLERERLEKERLERERLEKERLERERLEKERLEKERQRLEEERKEAERLEKLRIEQERIKKEREKLKQEMLEKERIRKEIERKEKEKQEKIRLEREKIEQERREIEKIEKEKLELEKLKRERKVREKLEKQKRKREKKLEKLKQKKQKELKKIKR
ncbi:MAG: hypothetical protein ACTSQJ_04935 [Promethearchaeota archaeon]